MDVRTRGVDLTEATQAAIDGRQSSVHTMLPCIVESVSEDGQHVTLQPTQKMRVRNPDGSMRWMSYPVIQDVPVHFPTGGGATLTFPIKKGDEALAMVASRSIDNWWQSGGEQQLASARMHDISDSFAFVGIKSSPSALAGVSKDAVQLRSNDGKLAVSLDVSAGTVSLSNGSVSLSMSDQGVDFSGGYIRHNGKNIGDVHVHGGVEPGAGDTATPH